MTDPMTEAKERLLAMRRARESFLGFVRYMHPDWVIPDFHRELIDVLDKLERRELRNEAGERVVNLMVNWPPRHAKSELCTKLFPTYYMLRRADRHVMSASYNSILARDFGRVVRDMARSKPVKQAFPEFKLSSKSVDAWTTPQDGTYFSVGLGATTSGRPATCFEAGTRVLTEHGEVQIERLRPGDRVVSFDHERNMLRVSRVLATKTSRRVTGIFGCLRCTPDHPIFDGHNYRPAEDFSDGNARMFTLQDAVQLSQASGSQVLLPQLLSGGNALRAHKNVPAMRQVVRGPRAEKGETEEVLLPGVPPREHEADREMSAVRHRVLSQARQQAAVLLKSVCREGGKWNAHWDASLRNVRKGVQTINRYASFLLNSLRFKSPFGEDGRLGEQQLAAWVGVPHWVQEAETACDRAGQQAVPMVRQQGRVGSASHRQQQAQRCDGELDHALQKLPQPPSQAVEVFDIQVEDDGNFFAEGTLVHNCLIVDDPVRNRKDADSKIKRDDTWNYYTSSLESRLQPESTGEPPIQVVILTRWHKDDMAGRLMKREEWQRGEWLHLVKPAILDESTESVLWPERFPYKWLARKREASPRDFASLYQQQPYTEGGDIIKREWWRFYDPNQTPAMEMVVITADVANKATELNDYTVYAAWGVSADADIYLLDLVRDKLEFPDLKRRLPVFAALFRGMGLRGVYIEDQQTGTALVQELKRETTLNVLGWRSFKDKVTRAHTVSPLVEGGRVYLPVGKPWVRGFLDEIEAFPNGEYDDQVDVMTMALDVLSRVAVSGESKALSNSDISLWRQYQEQQEIVLGSAALRRDKRSLRAQTGLGGWKGWGG